MTAIAGVDYNAILRGEVNPAQAVLDAAPACGLQATCVAEAEALARKVRAAKEADPAHRVVLCYTSNMISSGLRESFASLVRHGWVDAVIATAGGVEEDAIKSLAGTVLGDFALPGAALRKDGMNRVGNLLIPNDNYVAFEEYFVPLLEDTFERQKATRATAMTTPSEIIEAMGTALLRREEAAAAGTAEALSGPVEESLLAMCSRRGVPVFCPAVTDGSMGDMMFFFNFRAKGLVVDPLADLRNLRALLRSASGVSVMAMGGGLPKHHVLKAIRAEGAPLRHAILVATGDARDGSISANSLADDRSAGLMPPGTEVALVHAEATLVAPALFARVFV